MNVSLIPTEVRSSINNISTSKYVIQSNHVWKLVTTFCNWLCMNQNIYFYHDTLSGLIFCNADTITIHLCWGNATCPVRETSTFLLGNDDVFVVNKLNVQFSSMKNSVGFCAFDCKYIFISCVLGYHVVLIVTCLFR